MNLTHTPMGWKREGLTVYALNNEGTNRFRASLDPGHIPGYDSSRVQRNNAIIIQRAPEMLYCLEKILDVIDEQPSNERFLNFVLYNNIKSTVDKIHKDINNKENTEDTGSVESVNDSENVVKIDAGCYFKNATELIHYYTNKGYTVNIKKEGSHWMIESTYKNL